MLSSLVSALLAASLGQMPPPPPADNPMDSILNMVRPDVPIRDKTTMYAGEQQGYPAYGYGAPAQQGGIGGWSDINPNASYTGGYAGSFPGNYPGYAPAYEGGTHPSGGGQACGQGQVSIAGVGAFISGYAPKCNKGVHLCLGTYIGPFPGGMQAPGMTTQCPGGQCPQNYSQPIYMGPSLPVQSAVQGTRLEEEKEHKEINLRLEQLKNTLTKVTDTLKEMEKRLETTEKASLNAESKIRGLQDEQKQRWLLQDVETRLDMRIRPIEETLKQLARRLEYMHLQNGPKEPGAPEAKGGAKGFDERLLLQIDEKLDRLQLVIFDQLKTLNDRLNEEKIQRIRLEERLKMLEKGGAQVPPKEEVKKEEIKKEEKKEEKKDEKKDEKKEDLKKEDLKKDLKKEDLKKEDATNLSKLKVARVSHVHGGAPADRAVMVVHLPADAKLYLNGQATKSQGAQRTFVTPELEPGATFVYNVRVELMMGGEKVTQTRTVPFRAGGQAHVFFDGPRMDMQTAER